MVRIRRGPRARDKGFRPLQRRLHGDPCAYVRWRVWARACAGGRPHGATSYRARDAQHHRTRVHNVCLGPRGDPEAARRQKAPERLRALAPRPGDTRYVIRADSKQATRGTHMDAVATLTDPTTDASLWGHAYVCGTRRFRPQVIAGGLRRSGTQEAGAAGGGPTQAGVQSPCRGHGGRVVCCLLARSERGAGVSGATLPLGLAPHKPAPPREARLEAHGGALWAPALSAAPHRDPRHRDAPWARPLPRCRCRLAHGQPAGPPPRGLLADRDGPDDPRAAPRCPGTLRRGRHPDLRHTLDHGAVGERREAAAGARPVPAALVSSGSAPPASGVVRRCPPDPPAHRAYRCTRPPDT